MTEVGWSDLQRYASGAIRRPRTLCAYMAILLVLIPACRGIPESALKPTRVSNSEARVASAISRLDAEAPEDLFAAVTELEAIGPAAVPALVARLGQACPKTAFRIIWVLDEIGDKSAVLTLKQIVDQAPQAEFSEETMRSVDTPAARAVRAREAIVHILHPTSRTWEGANIGALPGASSFELRKTYHRRIKEWYDVQGRSSQGGRTRPPLA